MYSETKQFFRYCLILKVFFSLKISNDKMEMQKKTTKYKKKQKTKKKQKYNSSLGNKIKVNIVNSFFPV